MIAPAIKSGHSYVPLEQLLIAARDPSAPACLQRDGQTLSWQEWLQQVANWRQFLAQRPEQRWALYDRDTGRFAALMFALLSLDKTVCLPASAQPESLKQVVAQADGLLADIPAADCPAGLTFVSSLMPAPAADSCVLGSQPLPLDRDCIEVFTSGSTGAPQVIRKTLKQLSREIDHQHQLWSGVTSPLASATSVLVSGTVSHQHIYGLLFRVCWPLAAGWCLDAHTCEYLEELQQRQLNGCPQLLISSPTHLSRLPEQLDATITASLAAAYSSGAPLARSDSLLARQRLGCEIREIFGSSETGGIAWRTQDIKAEARWQPLPGVALKQAPDNQCLQVRSAHIGNDVEGIDWYSTSDRVQLDSEGMFSLLGRVDRIVKVEGKRIALDDMERQLLLSPWIQQAHLLLLAGRRTELGAVLCLTPNGQQQLRENGRYRFNQQLKQHLLCRFERPTLPRRWRYVQQLPVNAQGKLQRQTLLELFMNSERPRWPQLLTELPDAAVIDTEATYQLNLRVPEDLLYFDGHFAQAPILPGVVQVHWAEHFARKLFALEGECQQLEAIKFQQVIRPGQRLTLELGYQPSRGKVTFAYRSASDQHASGRLLFVPAAL